MPVSLGQNRYWEARDAAWEARPLPGCDKVACLEILPHVLRPFAADWSHDVVMRVKLYKQLDLSHSLLPLEDVVLLLLLLLPCIWGDRRLIPL